MNSRDDAVCLPVGGTGHNRSARVYRCRTAATGGGRYIFNTADEFNIDVSPVDPVSPIGLVRLRICRASMVRIRTAATVVTVTDTVTVAVVVVVGGGIGGIVRLG